MFLSVSLTPKIYYFLNQKKQIPGEHNVLTILLADTITVCELHQTAPYISAFLSMISVTEGVNGGHTWFFKLREELDSKFKATVSGEITKFHNFNLMT